MCLFYVFFKRTKGEIKLRLFGGVSTGAAHWRRSVLRTHCVSVDHLPNGDVDDRFGDGDQVWVLIHVELLFQRGDIARRQEETPAGEGKGGKKTASASGDAVEARGPQQVH